MYTITAQRKVLMYIRLFTDIHIYIQHQLISVWSLPLKNNHKICI
jgi:hypothetical protein